MNYYAPVRTNVPDYFRVFGHSWFQYTVGPSSDQTGRVDALLRSRLDIEFMNWRNYAGNGAKAIVQGGSTSGTTFNGGSWVRLYRHVQPNPSGYPYSPDGGASLLCFGINDLGILGGQNALVKSAFIHSMRAMISRLRASKVWLNNAASNLSYGINFTSAVASGEDASGLTLRSATTTTSASLTFTLPSDYTGQPVVFSFSGRGSAAGGVVTWTGTALTGNPALNSTTDTSGVVDSAWFTHTPIVKRITGLTSANAGQTIIGTVTSLGASGPTVYFDSVWLESTTPPPVIVCNIARIPDAAMTTLVAGIYANWTGTNASRDADVVAVNASLVSLAAEFDGMVQVADCDTVIGKDATKTSDGIHPNENGAGEIVDAIVTALGQMTPPATADSTALTFHPPAPRTGTQRRPRLVGYPYTADFATPQSTGVAVPAAGTGFWIPFQVTESRDAYSQFQVESVAAGTVVGSIRVGIYDDVEFSGYPQTLPNLTDYGTISLTNTISVKSLTMTFPWAPDPGLYWLCMVVVTQGTSITLRYIQSTSPSPFMPNRPTTGTTANAAYVGWTGTGISTTALPQRAPTNLTLVTAAPCMQMLKSK